MTASQKLLFQKIKEEPNEATEIVTLPGMPQTRTSCRIAGEYTLKVDDAYKHFDDSIGAIGDGLTYKWYCRNPGTTKFSAASVTTNTFSSIMTDARNGREVYCVITDQYGNSVQSDTVVMMRFAFTEQPQDAVVYKNGDTVTFTAHAEGQDVT